MLSSSLSESEWLTRIRVICNMLCYCYCLLSIVFAAREFTKYQCQLIVIRCVPCKSYPLTYPKPDIYMCVCVYI